VPREHPRPRPHPPHIHALHHRTDRTYRKCETCNGQRVVIQISREMHDAWVTEAQAKFDGRLQQITHYLCVPVRQLPNLPAGTVQVADCWDCCELPPVPDDLESLERYQP
jgi:hypothetical protein